MKLENHVLYGRPTCPYCGKVFRIMEKYGIECDVVDTNDPENLEKLEELTGRRTVPCLFIDGEPMWESSDIIVYMKSKLKD